MRLVWRQSARRQLADIIGYIAASNLAAADRLGERIEFVAERLPDLPFVHRKGRLAGMREAAVHPNYIMIYQVGAEEVTILSVLHARRRYP